MFSFAVDGSFLLVIDAVEAVVYILIGQYFEHDEVVVEREESLLSV